ncbi:hypothetical protein EZS27_008251 [termite gut metagenome]|uniref:Uncharacterized protein n=1 Tax=termite gut metagenome TaxID=433724 RepID=A0A5J4SDC7_9ZZZZ
MKLCPQCERENPSSANYCMYCRSALTPDEQVDEIDKLHQELSEANTTIQLLKKALATAQEQAEKQPEKIDAIIRSLQAELTDMKQKCSEYEEIIAAQKNTNETSSQELADASKGKKNGYKSWIWFFLLSVFILPIFVLDGPDGEEQEIEWVNHEEESLRRVIEDLRSENGEFKLRNEEFKSENEKFKSENEKLKSENEELKIYRIYN